MLHIKNLNVDIGDENILNNLSLNVKKGEVHAVMGPNGSGKSTLAKVVSGHPGYQVTNGSIEFKVGNKTKDVLQMDTDLRSKTGIFTAFQYPITISNLTNFKFFHSFFSSHCAYQGIDSMNEEAFKKYVINLLPKVNIDKEFLERNVNDGFSGGERKKNEILQMLLMKPKLVILDEIDSGLDIDSLKVISNCINEYRSKDNAVVMITHYQRILNYVKPDYVHIIYDGSIVKTGDIKLSHQIEEQGYEKAIQIKGH